MQFVGIIQFEAMFAQLVTMQSTRNPLKMPYEDPHYLYMKRTAASDHTDTAALSNKVIIYEERLMVYFYDEAGQSDNILVL